MRDRLQTWYRTIIIKWKDLTKKQKIQIAALAGIVTVGLVITLILAFRTTWEPAFEGVDAATAGRIQEVLGEVGIASQTDLNAGLLLVPQGSVDRAKMAVHLSPVMLSPDYTFRDAISDSGMGVSATMQHEQIVRARETEVAHTLMGFAHISSADVGLTVPQVPLFLQPQTPSSAIVRLTGTRTLTPEDGLAAALVASRMVAGLTLENVTVQDENFIILFDNGEMQDGGGATGMTADVNFASNVRIDTERRAIQVVDDVFDSVQASANIIIDWARFEEFSRTFASPLGEDSMEGLLDWEEWARNQGTTTPGAVGGPPGVDANPPGILFPGNEAPGTTSFEEEERRRRFLQNMTERITHAPNMPGQLVLDDSSISLTLTNHIIYYEHEQRELGNLDDMSWAQFRNATGTEQLYFHDFEEQFVTHIQNATGIPNVSLIFRNVHHFVDEDVAGLPIAEIVLFSLLALFIGMLAFLMIRRTAPDIVEEIEPELSVEDLLVSSQLEEAKAADIERLAEIQFNADSQVKEQIDKFALEKPENVAQLLRNWINEDWE